MTSDTADSPTVRDPILSIVTVTLNDLDGLKATLSSIRSAFDARAGLAGRVDVIVKDGGSRDGTIAFLDTADMPGPTVASGPDGGIYPAMNAALGLARGRWILFLNAGDSLADPDALHRLVAALDRPGATNLVYADCLVDGVVQRQTLSLRFLTAHMINHQSICYHRDLLGDGYDTRYRYCADYAHLLSVYAQLKPFKLGQPIARYDSGGVSSDPRNYHRLWRERLQAVWRSQLPLPARLMLSSRGLVMWPLQFLRARLT